MNLRVIATAVFAFALGMAPGVGAVAQPSEAAARNFSDAIEKRAATTSFAALTAFGENASTMNGAEALRRLHHVAFIFLNQSEYVRFDHFNDLLARKAAAGGDERYAEVARIDALKARYDQGDGAVAPQLVALAKSESDWFARTHAMMMLAVVEGSDQRAGESLRTLFQADRLIPDGDPDSASAKSDIWETIGLELVQLNDLQGAAEAFQKADFTQANPNYPHPDFDDIYNLAQLAAQLGDADLARYLAAAHHRLTSHSDLEHLAVWDKFLCATVADSFQPPQAVMDCLSGLDSKLTGADFLAPKLRALRGIAEARLGDVVAARSDLTAIQALQESGKYASSRFIREPQLGAELAEAEGHHADAFALLRAYGEREANRQAELSSHGVRQMTAELETQLQAANHRAELQDEVLRSQRWIFVLGGLLAVGCVVALIWERRVAARLKAAQQRAELASRSKTEFLANMSHEIRTPLNGVVGVADMLASAGLPERERKMAEIIKSSGQSLERLLSDVLDLARVEAGQLTIEKTPFHAADLVRAVAALCRLRADEKGLALTAEIDPALEGWFIGDAVRVRQILTNLTSNAVKFTERGSVTLRAEMTPDRCIRLSVIDTGVGFDAEAKSRLFSRFQQADGSITRRFGGTGLGLAISRQLATLMEGEVDCESTPGVGSSFWFAARFEPTAAPEEELALADEATAPGQSLRILMADDHATNQLVVRMMLEQFGIDTVVVDDGAQAVAALRREAFNCVLMDMQMPVMDGLEATRVIRAEEIAEGRPRTPILMLSANALAEHRAAGAAAGADGHVAKPVTVANLMAALNAVLDPEAAEEPTPQVGRA